ncbi:IucA/IucC family protein [Streptomyces sp. NPDC001616]|uniref:IucA/IucC family protein n=1 Tax=Streptomyces sp. NPDC001616 TaxID=3156648 RepID=UPI003328F9C3
MPSLTDSLGSTADEATAHTLHNCLLREVSGPEHQSVVTDGRLLLRLPRRGVLLRVALRRTSLLGAHRFTGPVAEQRDGEWTEVDWRRLAEYTHDELSLRTGVSNEEFLEQLASSHEAVATSLAATRAVSAPDDRLSAYLASEQSLLFGHRFHPTPKARTGDPRAWSAYAPEVGASFPLRHLAVRAGLIAEECAAASAVAPLDGLRSDVPDGYRLLPAHPWQLGLVDLREAFADGRLVRIGTTALDAWPTAAIRTLYASERDLFLKFSLDVRITNDIRRLWRHDLLKLRRTDSAVTSAFAALPGPAAWLSDRGYRTADFAFEELAVLVRDGLHDHLLPGATPLLAAGLVEGFDGSPLDDAADPAAWWEAYLKAVVPPALAAFADHGVVLEAHLQNTLVAVDADGLPVQALFRDVEGVKLLPDVSREAGWERLVYCLVVNHLTEIAAALAERRPGLDPWPAARRELSRHDLPEIAALLTAPTLPGKTNLLLRWTGADGADARYLPLPNPLAD